MAPNDRRALAVGVAFVANGLAVASFLARLPERQDDLHLSDGDLGLVLVGLALGALAVSPLAAALIARLGSAPTVVSAACLLGITLPLAALATGGPQLFAVLLVIGAADATFDIAMNANGAIHQAERGRSIMHRLHAAWAIGALAAAGLAALAARANLPLTPHLALVGAAVVTAALVIRPRLPTDGPSTAPRLPADTRSTAPGDPADGRSTAPSLLADGQPTAPHLPADGPSIDGRSGAPRWRAGRLRPIAGLCAAMVGVALVEGAPNNWAAVHLKHLGAGDAVAALGLAGFTAGMIGGRLVGDHLTDHWGAGTVLRAGMILAAAGFGLGAAVAQPAAFIAAMATAGVGISGCFPLLFGAAARAPGLAPGAGVATASLAARTGFLVQPALIGAAGDHVGLRPAFAGLAAVAGAVAAAAVWVLPGGKPSANLG